MHCGDGRLVKQPGMSAAPIGTVKPAKYGYYLCRYGVGSYNYIINEPQLSHLAPNDQVVTLENPY